MDDLVFKRIVASIYMVYDGDSDEILLIDASDHKIVELGSLRRDTIENLSGFVEELKKIYESRKGGWT